MAGEEDVELRDLVAQTLETKGVLGKIRAQLRASVFLALEEHESDTKPHPLASSKLQEFLKTKDGQMATALVREFLEFFELDYTCAVFDPESNALETYPGREKLAEELGMDAQVSTTNPLLASLLQKARYSPPHSSAMKHLKFPEQATSSQETNRTCNDTSNVPPPSRRPFDELPPLSPGKFVQLRENDIALKNSTFTPSLQPLTNALNTNENSNLHPVTSSMVPKETSHLPTVTQNGLDLTKPKDLTDISVGSLHDRGVHAELGESFTNNSALDIEKLLNPTEDSDRDLLLAGTKTGTDESGRDELDDFFDSIVPSKIEEDAKPSSPDSHISEELSTPLSSTATGKLETEDLTMSQHSLLGDFDYSEQVQS